MPIRSKQRLKSDVTLDASIMADLCNLGHAYQRVSGAGLISAIDYAASAKDGSRNPAKPQSADFRCDVWNCIRDSFPVRKDQLLFLAVIELADWQAEWEDEAGKTRTKYTPDRAVAAFNKLWGTRWLYWVAKFVKAARRRNIVPSADYFRCVRIGTHKMTDQQMDAADREQFRYYWRHKLTIRADQPWQFTHRVQPLITLADVEARSARSVETVEPDLMPEHAPAVITLDCGTF